MSQADEISIQFPARRGFLYLTRLNASAVGTEAGLDIDELDDLRLAVNELINWLLMDAEGDGQVNLSFFALDGTIEIIGTCLLYTSPSPRDATLSRMPSSA